MCLMPVWCADTGGEKWGRKFEPEGSVNPVLAATDSPHKRVTNFETKIPADAPDSVKVVHAQQQQQTMQ